jgi:acetyl-CoA acetyltransferase
MLSKAFIPYKGYYTTPFCRYGKSFKDHNSIVLSAETSKQWLALNNIPTQLIDYIVYGTSVHQHHGFWAGPWSAAIMGAEHTTGEIISQACTTGATSLFRAASNIEVGLNEVNYCLVSDRTSNSPTVTWGENDNIEHWVQDNFEFDPWGKTSMLQTAENVAKKYNVTKSHLDEVTACRYEQYDNSDFGYMFPVGDVTRDEGPKKINLKRLNRLKPVLEGGIHSVGNLTYPADGHCGILVTDKQIANDLNNDATIQVVSYAYSKCGISLMPEAALSAADKALKDAGITIDDVKVINQHNAFAVNDIILADHFNIDVFKMNNYGSPLVYGHPQAPVLSRLIIEGIEECVLLGGGYVLVCGAAAGDTGAAVVLKVL